MNPLRDADLVGYVNPDGSGEGNWLAHSYADEVYRRSTYEWYRPTAREQFVDAIGCAASMAGILIGALVIWGLLIALFVGATNV